MASKPGRFGLILGAGKGTRFKSVLPKVLHPLAGRPLIEHVLEKLLPLELDRIFVLTGHASAQVEQALANYPVEFIHQEQQLGTGHAVASCETQMAGLDGSLLVVYGDTPLITTNTLAKLLECQQRQDAQQVLLAARLEDPTGYGRLVREPSGSVIKIVEEKEATQKEKAIHEINTGINCFELTSLWPALSKLSDRNRAEEFYLTDLVEIFHSAKQLVVTLETQNPKEVLGINDRADLANLEAEVRQEIATKWMLAGVTIVRPDSVLIDSQAKIGPDTILYPGVILEGPSQVGSACKIYANSYLRNSKIGDRSVVNHCSVVCDSSVGADSQIGPFAHLRKDNQVGAGIRVGNFVELKNTSMGDHSKAAHLTYLGDAKIGHHTNVGAGTITCNYDGEKKHQTVIGNDVFIGSNSQLIAPVTVEEGAYIAAGSTISERVPAYALSIARSKQIIKENWAQTRVRARRKRRG